MTMHCQIVETEEEKKNTFSCGGQMLCNGEAKGKKSMKIDSH